MGDVLELEDEALEPLFDYSRVQPVKSVPFLDDETFEPFPYGIDGKKRKRGKDVGDPTGKDGKVSSSVVNLDEEEEGKEEEEDWLPLPPQNIVNSKRNSEIDETIQKLRLNKMELASFAHTSHIILDEVIETAKAQITTSRSAAESVDKQSESEAQRKTQVEKQKIVVCIQAKDDNKQFRVYKDDKLDKLFKSYAERLKLNFEKLVFCFDGDKICPGASPHSLGMEDGDIIEMYAKSC